MAITSNQLSVGTTATALTPGVARSREIVIKNAGATGLFLGGLAVTTTTGFELGAGATIGLRANHAVFGIVASGTVVVHVMTTE